MQRRLKWKGQLLLGLACLVLTWFPVPTSAQEEDDNSSIQLDDVVVSATRSEMNKEELPSVVELISPEDLETTVDSNMTRVLKKNSSVDVIDYPGVLSGISIRGFRPEYNGITKHSLILIDGRPAGAENIASILKSNVERIEVLKGPASALYGAEAMGGVVNIITKKSKGDINTSLTVGGGSFDTHYESLSSGGAVNEKLDFDISVSNKNQNDDFTMGNGDKRANTSFKETNAALRIGSSLNDILRLDVKGDWYGGRDIMTPNAMHYGDTRPSVKDIDRFGGDITMVGTWKKNVARFTLYAADESYDTTKKYKGETPYKSYDTETNWLGAQFSDTYSFTYHELTVGFDYQSIDEESRSYNSDGSGKTPSSPNNGRENIGVYGDGFLRFFDEHMILSCGLRYDKFDLETKQTPYKTNYTPGSESFDIVNPRAGVKYFLGQNRLFQFHATIGTAFVPPNALEMAGYAETELTDGTIMYLRGNPDLEPEKSMTWDGGLTLHKRDIGLYMDLTYFHTDVDDKITDINISDTERTYVNAFEAEMSGLEWELSEDFGVLLGWNRKLELYFNGTHFFKAEEQTEEDQWKDIYNVSDTKFNTGLSYMDDMFFGKFNVRYAGKRKDRDYYTTGYPEIEFDESFVCDLSVGVTMWTRHKVKLSIENIFDEYYYEKPQYPMMGRAIYVDYTFTF